ncbi:MAG: succinylglutamate desuccinylase/aspartoacylase family protein [Anaerolineaceae bacterium]|nr:succinylglutamate desuccinylase/aspartoacylase family protein [Anaerolineaceae bacterium]
MLKVGNITARPGERAFGYLETMLTRAGMAPDIPVHLVAGASPGPTLLVQGAMHGAEIIGSIAILNFLEKIDPETMSGNVIAVPVANRAGFELGERGSRIDGKDITRQIPGDPNGSACDQIAHIYFQEVISQANVMVDFHAGARTAYERYVLFMEEDTPKNLTEVQMRRRKIVVAFGLDQAAYFPRGTFGGTETKRSVEDLGVVQITLEFGGGTGWHKNGMDNVRDAERGIWNLLKSMRIIEGEFETDGDLCTVYNAGVVIWKPNADGLFIRKRAFRDELKAGDVYGELVSPWTGELVAELKSPKDGIVIPSGQEWPTVGSTSIGILGTIDRVEDRRTMDMYVSF